MYGYVIICWTYIKHLTRQSRWPVTLGGFGMDFGTLGELVVAYLIVGVSRHGVCYIQSDRIVSL